MSDGVSFESGPQVNSAQHNQDIENGSATRFLPGLRGSFEGSAFNVNGITFKFHGNGALTHREGLSDNQATLNENILLYRSALCQKGLLVCGADDHAARFYDGSEQSLSSAPFYVHPDAAQLINDFDNEVWSLLGGKEGVWKGHRDVGPVEDFVLELDKIVAMVDFVLTDERFTEYNKIVDAHMQSVTGKPTL